MDTQQTIGVDIGGTKIECALVDGEGHVLASHRLPTLADEGLEAVLSQVRQGVAELQADSALAVGVGCPGFINAEGVILHAANLGWQNVPLQNLLTSTLGRRVVVENDARAALIGEMRFGAGRGFSDVVYFSVGTGLGGAAVVDGRLLHGKIGVAMEVGQLRGQDGALVEYFASGTGLLHLTERLRVEHPTVLAPDASTHDILSAFHQGDGLAVQAVNVWLGHIHEAALWACGFLNPSALIIGGGIGLAAYPLIEQSIRATLNERSHPYVAESVQLLPAQVESSAVGAAALVAG